MIVKHYVTFVSPGTFVPETNTEEVESWDIERAKLRASEINQRYGARPYSFVFYTMTNDGTELNSKETARSPNYFLGGTVLTLQDIKDRNDPDDSILISNMENNDMPRVIENRNSYRATLPLGKDDVVLDFVMPERVEAE
jgi:hypothetical protein